MKKAIYAGTFDPITFGHLWMIEAAAALFDELVIAVALNPTKKCTFTIERRVEMIAHAIKFLENTTVMPAHGMYLVDIARACKAGHIIRGLRNQNDYLYEHTMRNINADMAPTITTVFLMPPRELTEISSSMVKGLVGFDGWEQVVRRYVPENVAQQLQEANNAQTRN